MTGAGGLNWDDRGTGGERDFSRKAAMITEFASNLDVGHERNRRPGRVSVFWH